jgi:hypothetical protein
MSIVTYTNAMDLSGIEGYYTGHFSITVSKEGTRATITDYIGSSIKVTGMDLASDGTYFTAGTINHLNLLGLEGEKIADVKGTYNAHNLSFASLGGTPRFLQRCSLETIRL